MAAKIKSIIKFVSDFLKKTAFKAYRHQHSECFSDRILRFDVDETFSTSI